MPSACLLEEYNIKNNFWSSHSFSLCQHIERKSCVSCHVFHLSDGPLTTHKLLGFWIYWFSTGLHLREAGSWPGACLWKKDPRGPVFIPVFEIIEEKARRNLKQYHFLGKVSWWCLKNEIPVGNGHWFSTSTLSVTHVLTDSSFPRFLLEVFSIKQGLGCWPFQKPNFWCWEVFKSLRLGYGCAFDKWEKNVWLMCVNTTLNLFKRFTNEFQAPNIETVHWLNWKNSGTSKCGIKPKIKLSLSFFKIPSQVTSKLLC